MCRAKLEHGYLSDFGLVSGGKVTLEAGAGGFQPVRTVDLSRRNSLSLSSLKAGFCAFCDQKITESRFFLKRMRGTPTQHSVQRRIIELMSRRF
jgi:hypothetical protein